MINGYNGLPAIPDFLDWAFNMIQRMRNLQQSGIFLKQNSGEAHMAIAELREMAMTNNSTAFKSVND